MGEGSIGSLLVPLIGRAILIAFKIVPVTDLQNVNNLGGGAGTITTVHRAIFAGDLAVHVRSLEEAASNNGAGGDLDGLGNGSCGSIGVGIGGWYGQGSHWQKTHRKDGHKLHGWYGRDVGSEMNLFLDVDLVNVSCSH